MILSMNFEEGKLIYTCIDHKISQIYLFVHVILFIFVLSFKRTFVVLCCVWPFWISSKKQSLSDQNIE